MVQIIPVAIALGALLLACVLPCVRWLLGGWWRAAVDTYTLGTKLKQIIGFYQIATRLEHVYVLYLTEAARGVLNALRIAISIGTGAAMPTDEYTRERHPSRRLRASVSLWCACGRPRYCTK